jgi:hypothetical protein
LSQWRSIEVAGNERKLLVHAVKLSIQYFNENRMKSAPHPPYSPNIAQSDFYLFGYVKRCLTGLSFEDADQILAAVEGVLEGIEKMTLQAVFLEWMDRLRKCIITNGEHTGGPSGRNDGVRMISEPVPVIRAVSSSTNALLAAVT